MKMLMEKKKTRKNEKERTGKMSRQSSVKSQTIEIKSGEKFI